MAILHLKSINDPPSLVTHLSHKLDETHWDYIRVFECDFPIKSFNKNSEFVIHKIFKNKSPEIHKEEIAQPHFNAWALLLKRIMVTLKGFFFFFVLYMCPHFFAYYTLHETKNPSKVSFVSGTQFCFTFHLGSNWGWNMNLIVKQQLKDRMTLWITIVCLENSGIVRYQDSSRQHLVTFFYCILKFSKFWDIWIWGCIELIPFISQKCQLVIFVWIFFFTILTPKNSEKF
jgi:hypothetical protein